MKFILKSVKQLFICKMLKAWTGIRLFRFDALLILGYIAQANNSVIIHIFPAES